MSLLGKQKLLENLTAKKTEHLQFKGNKTMSIDNTCTVMQQLLVLDTGAHLFALNYDLITRIQ